MESVESLESWHYKSHDWRNEPPAHWLEIKVEEVERSLVSGDINKGCITSPLVGLLSGENENFNRRANNTQEPRKFSNTQEHSIHFCLTSLIRTIITNYQLWERNDLFWFCATLMSNAVEANYFKWKFSCQKVFKVYLLHVEWWWECWAIEIK